jgi:hypothetical protein
MSRLSPTSGLVTRAFAIKPRPITALLRGVVTTMERIWSELDYLQIFGGDRQVAAKVTFLFTINLQSPTKAE